MPLDGRVKERAEPAQNCGLTSLLAICPDAFGIRYEAGPTPLILDMPRNGWYLPDS